ncbi:DUF72 domain-containing protein [Thermodesulfobacteriota bacterium]
MAEILVGTSGFHYDDWKVVFYPSGMPQKDYLSFYASHFKVLELNFSYYRLPEARQSRQMIEKSDGRIEFIVKAHQEMTHRISQNSLAEVLDLFLQGIAPFMDSDCLGGILLQFPQSFHYTTKNRVYLKSLIERLLPNPLFVEFRQKQWLKESVFQTLRQLKTGFVCVDEPPLPSLPPPMVTNTSNLGYIRFHGRNSEDWYGTDSRTRYDYLYTEGDLKSWIPEIIKLSADTDKLYIFFNNHARGQAVTNAKMLINLLP